MKKSSFCMLIILIPIFAMASNDFDKFDARLKALLHNYDQSKIQLPKGSSLTQTIDDSNYLNVFLVGEATTIEAVVKSRGGVVNTVAGDILTAKIPINEIVNVSKSDAVKQIQLSAPIKLYNDAAIKNVNADKVHSGMAPLQTGYTGKGVIVGIMDTGIDWRHEDFRKPSDQTKSRILYIWDQYDNDGSKPDGFSYGSEWTKAQIEDELDGTPANVINYKDDNPYTVGEHGTHVSGTAAGNKGLAPGADLIVVALDFNVGSTNVLDAANYIFKKAAELGKPTVINASFGSPYSSLRDGTSAEAKGLDNLVNAAPGRAFVASAGNDGEYNIHFGGFELQNTPNWTYFYGYPYGTVYINAVIDNKYLNSISIAVGADSVGYDGKMFSSVKNIGQTDWKTIQDVKDNTFETGINYPDGSQAGEISISAGNAGDYSTELYITIHDDIKRADDGSKSGHDLWRLYFQGSGIFHAWAEQYVNTISNPAELGISVDAQYRSPDNKFAIGVPAVAKKVIAVGAYTNRTSYVDDNGITQQLDGTVGELASFSSRGPSVDGRIKPEIVAPGVNVISASLPGIDGNNNNRVMWSGTSMSSPVVTGAIALLLEKYPTYTVDQIRSMITNNALTDNFTASNGALPNDDWGYGKLDIFAALSNQLEIETTDNSIIPQSYTLSQNYPNPFNPTTNVDFSTPKDGLVKFTIHDILGRVVYTENKELVAGNYSLRWDGINNFNQRVVSGIYFIKMDAEGFSQSRKMLLMK